METKNEDVFYIKRIPPDAGESDLIGLVRQMENAENEQYERKTPERTAARQRWLHIREQKAFYQQALDRVHEAQDANFAKEVEKWRNEF